MNAQERKKYFRAYYLSHRDSIRARQMNYYVRNRDVYLQEQRKRKRRRTGSVKGCLRMCLACKRFFVVQVSNGFHCSRACHNRTWLRLHPERAKVLSTMSYQRCADRLSDGYVKNLLRNDDWSLQDISTSVLTDLIEVKRAQLKIKRELRKT